MMRPSRAAGWLAALALFCTRTVIAAEVTITVKTASGAAAADAVAVLDPLDATPAPTHDAAVIDQINKRYVPQVTIIRTGTAVTFPNSDHIRHQVYSFSSAKAFNLKLYAGSPKEVVVFDKAGLVVLGCNIHDTMVAFVGVVDSPYFGKVSGSGSVTLEVPAGRYRLRVWQRTLASVPAPRNIDVGTAPLTVPLVVETDPGRDTIAVWPE